MSVLEASSTPESLQTIEVSVVLATIGDSEKAARLEQVLDALDLIDEVREVVLVWQGDPASPLIPSGHKGLRVVLSGTKALSHARNAGARIATFDWLWFLDDDTIPIGTDYIRRAQRYLREYSCEFAVANVRTTGRIRVAARTERTFYFDNIRATTEFWEPGLLMIRRTFLNFLFDEQLGIGCLHGASEGHDLGLRLLAGGVRGIRHVDLELDHPPLVFDAKYGNKVAFYSFGNALVIIRHRLYANYFITLTKTVAKIGLNAARLDWRQTHWALIRLWALLLGPLLQPQPPFVVGSPPQEIIQRDSQRPSSARA